MFKITEKNKKRLMTMFSEKLIDVFFTLEDKTTEYGLSLLEVKDAQELKTQLDIKDVPNIPEASETEDGLMTKEHVKDLNSKPSETEVKEWIAQIQIGGDIDLSVYETTESIDRKLQGLATETFVIENIAQIKFPNLEHLATKEDLNSYTLINTTETLQKNLTDLQTELSNLEFWFNSELIDKVSKSDLNFYATIDFVNRRISEIPATDLSSYIKTEEVDRRENILNEVIKTKADESSLKDYETIIENDRKLSVKATYQYVDDLIQTPKIFSSDGAKKALPKIWVGEATAKDGVWQVDFSSANFTEPPFIYPIGFTINDGKNAGDGRYATVIKESITTTTAQGKLNSANSAGLLAAMVNVHADGQVGILAIGI